MMKKVVGVLAVGMLVLLVAIQAVPYGRNHTNPSVRREPAWDSPGTRALAVRACFDCHSNQTTWPWYSSLAPISWVVRRDVDEGRQKVNFSEWNRPQEEAAESAESVQKGTMPPWYYPWAQLSAVEREALIRGLAATLGQAHNKEKKSSAPREPAEGSRR